MKKNKVLKLFSIPIILVCSVTAIVSCSQNNSGLDNKNLIIETINQSIINKEIKPNKDIYTRVEYDQINKNNILSNIVLPSNIDKTKLEVVDFVKNDNRIKFQIVNEGQTSNVISLVFNLDNNPLPQLPEISAVALKLRDDKIEYNVNEEVVMIASLTPNNITNNLKYEWIKINSQNNERVMKTTTVASSYTFNTVIGDNDSRLKVRVTQEVNSHQIVKESNVITIKVKQVSSPEINWNDLISKEKEKWNNFVFPEQKLTQDEIDNIRNNQMQEIEFIAEQLNLLDIDNFVYEFNVQDVTASAVLFQVVIYPNDSNHPEFEINNEFNYTIKQVSQNNLQEVVDKLNVINWNDFKYDEFVSRGLVFRDLSNKGIDNGYVLNFINNFNPVEFCAQNNNVQLDVNANTFKLDVLKQILKFKIKVLKDGNSLDSNEFTINFKTPKKLQSALDGDENTDPSIKLTNSLKGVLTYLQKPINPLTETLFRGRYNKFFNTSSNLMSRQFRYLEMLYQARFIFYQSFGDNATSIDYGIENNRVVLKAKIKDAVVIQKPYIQILNDENNLSNVSLTQGEVLTITLTPTNIDDSWEIINNNNALGSKSSPFLYGKGPEVSAIQNGGQLVSFGQNQKHWYLSITVNQKTILNKSLNLRFNFCFLVSCIKKD